MQEALNYWPSRGGLAGVLRVGGGRRTAAYRELCTKVANLYPALEKHIVLENLTRDAYALGTSGFYSKLLFTVKTHKSPGEVKTRNVHSSVGNPVPDH